MHTTAPQVRFKHKRLRQTFSHTCGRPGNHSARYICSMFISATWVAEMSVNSSAGNRWYQGSGPLWNPDRVPTASDPGCLGISQPDPNARLCVYVSGRSRDCDSGPSLARHTHEADADCVSAPPRSASQLVTGSRVRLSGRVLTPTEPPSPFAGGSCRLRRPCQCHGRLGGLAPLRRNVSVDRRSRLARSHRQTRQRRGASAQETRVRRLFWVAEWFWILDAFSL